MPFMQPLVRQAVLFSVALAACSSSTQVAKKPPAPCPLPNPVLSAIASDRVNADPSGQGRPVQLRVYQLKSEAKLQGAQFNDIWQNDAKFLEGDLVKSSEYTLYPGETKRVKIDRNPEAHTLAAVALFREPQGKTWFLTYDLQPPKSEAPCGPAEPGLSVFLDRMQIEDGQGH